MSLPSWDYDKRHACHHGGQERPPQIPPWKSNPAASRQFQFFDFLDSRNRARSERFMQVPKVILEILKRLPLRPVIRVIVQVAEEHPIVFLPISEFGRHNLKLVDSQAVVCCFLQTTHPSRTQEAQRTPTNPSIFQSPFAQRALSISPLKHLRHHDRHLLLWLRLRIQILVQLPLRHR